MTTLSPIWTVTTSVTPIQAGSAPSGAWRPGVTREFNAVVLVFLFRVKRDQDRAADRCGALRRQCEILVLGVLADDLRGGLRALPEHDQRVADLVRGNPFACSDLIDRVLFDELPLADLGIEAAGVPVVLRPRCQDEESMPRSRAPSPRRHPCRAVRRRPVRRALRPVR